MHSQYFHSNYQSSITQLQRIQKHARFVKNATQVASEKSLIPRVFLASSNHSLITMHPRVLRTTL